MRRFLLAAFHITWFQIGIIASFVLVKLVIVSNNLGDKIQKPIIWVLFGAGVLFVLSMGISGIIENRNTSTKNHVENLDDEELETRINNPIIRWGLGLLPILIYAVFLFMITPTTWLGAVAFFSGIVLKNIVDFFRAGGSENQVSQ